MSDTDAPERWHTEPYDPEIDEPTPGVMITCDGDDEEAETDG